MIFGKNILIAVAHPDDEVLGVGGTIPLIKALGGKVTVLMVTDGSTTQYAGDSEILKRKHDQMIRANEILGSDCVLQWDFPDMRLDSVDHADVASTLEQLIGEKGFDGVITHSEGDVNLDHKLLYHSVLTATRPLPGQTVKRVFCCQINSATEWGARDRATVFLPNVFIDIEETIDLKIQAMEAYADELRTYPHPRSSEGLRQRAQVYGFEVGYRYAEPFELKLYHGLIT